MTVVFRGSFNPAIFHPAWFEYHGLVREDEARNAKIVVVSPQVAIFSTEQFSFHVTDDHFAAGTSQVDAFDPLRDLVVGTFKYLSHTPLRLLGINRTVHFEAGSPEVWHTVGHTLAPKDVWSPILEKPGMRSLSIEGERTDGYVGAVNVRIEPSTRVKPGVFVEINDHYQSEGSEEDRQPLASQLATILDSEWQNSLARSQRIIDHLGEFIWKLHNEKR